MSADLPLLAAGATRAALVVWLARRAAGDIAADPREWRQALLAMLGAGLVEWASLAAIDAAQTSGRLAFALAGAI